MQRVNLDIDDGYDFKKVEHNHWKVRTESLEKFLIVLAPVFPILLSNILWLSMK